MAAKYIDYDVTVDIRAPSRSSSEGSDDDDEEYEHKKLQTTAIMYDFFDATMENDMSLGHCDRIKMKESVSHCIRLEDLTPSEASYSEHVVLLLREHGKEFDRRLTEDKELQEASKKALEEETDLGDSWFVRVTTHLKDVIEGYFGYDDDGNLRNITLGGIFAIFLYCYNICRRWIFDHPRERIIQLLMGLGASLVVSFINTKFFNWLEQRGGWLQALVGLIPTNPVSQALLGPPSQWPNNFYLFAGLTMIGIWAYNRYVRKQ